MSDAKKDKITRIREMLQDEPLTSREVRVFIDTILQYVKKVRDEFDSLSRERLSEFTKISNSHIKSYEALENKTGEEYSASKKEIASKVKELTALISKIKNLKLEDGEKGERGDDGKDGSPDTPIQVRDKLESLEKGEKLSINAIEDLSDIIEDLSKKLKEFGSTRRAGSYGTKLIRFLDDQTPIGTIDGISTTFTIIKTPIEGSLKIYRNGQRLKITEDYTFDGYRTFDFVVPPRDGEIILYDLRY